MLLELGKWFINNGEEELEGYLVIDNGEYYLTVFRDSGKSGNYTLNNAYGPGKNYRYSILSAFFVGESGRLGRLNGYKFHVLSLVKRSFQQSSSEPSIHFRLQNADCFFCEPIHQYFWDEAVLKLLEPTVYNITGKHEFFSSVTIKVSGHYQPEGGNAKIEKYVSVRVNLTKAFALKRRDLRRLLNCFSFFFTIILGNAGTQIYCNDIWYHPGVGDNLFEVIKIAGHNVYPFKNMNNSSLSVEDKRTLLSDCFFNWARVFYDNEAAFSFFVSIAHSKSIFYETNLLYCGAIIDLMTGNNPSSTKLEKNIDSILEGFPELRSSLKKYFGDAKPGNVIRLSRNLFAHFNNTLKGQLLPMINDEEIDDDMLDNYIFDTVRAAKLISLLAIYERIGVQKSLQDRLVRDQLHGLHST